MTAQHLILIRHSAVTVFPEKPAATWQLSEQGHIRAQRLAEDLRPYNPKHISSSVEPKAIETGEIIAAALQLPSATAPNLHEHVRDGVPFAGHKWFEAQMQEFFSRPHQLVFGSETADEAHLRFTTAVNKLLHQYPSDNAAIVTHGTALTLYVSRRAEVAPFPFWKQLGLPAFVGFALPECSLSR